MPIYLFKSSLINIRRDGPGEGGRELPNLFSISINRNVQTSGDNKHDEALRGYAALAQKVENK